MSSQRGRVRVEDGPKRVRVQLGGVWVADTTRVKLVWEIPYFPTYYFHPDDVALDSLVATGESYRSPSRGSADLYTVKAGGSEAENAARVWTGAEFDEIDGHVSFKWAAMDAWFEEDEEVFVHPRDPYSRIDILQSSRHVEVVVNGVKVADSHQPRFLFETNLPTRYYLPKTDVRMDLLTPTDTMTACPYKGNAEYWSVEADGERFEDIVWGYRFPLAESISVAGYVCFYNEKVDTYIDGELEERPKTKFG